MVIEIRIRASKKYGNWLARHLAQEHRKTRGHIKLKKLKGGSI